MRSIEGRAASCVLVAALLLASTRARAEPTPSQRAETLYLEAKRFAAAGAYDRACPLFEQSQALEPAIGTQFNLAECLEVTMKRASALRLFREVTRVAQLSGKQERQRAAIDRAAALESTVGRVVVTIADPQPGLRIRLDGIEVSAETLANGVPADPGEHSLRFEAPAHLSAEALVVVSDAPGARAFVNAPKLQKANREVVVAVEGPPLRPLAVGLLSGGAVGIVTGTVFGVIAMTKKDEAACERTDCSVAPVGSADTLKDAQSAGTISTIAFIAGGVLGAAGLVVLIAGPSGAHAVDGNSDSKKNARVKLELVGTGAAIRGVF